MPLPLPSLRQIAARWHPYFGNLLIIAFVAAMGAFFLYQSRAHYERQARLSADNLTQLLVRQIGSVIEKTDLALSAVAFEVERQQVKGKIQPDALKLLLERYLPLLPEVHKLRVTDEKGWLMFGTDTSSDTHINFSDRSYFSRIRDAQDGRLVIDGPILGRITKRWVMVFGRRLNHPDGSFAGAVFISIDIERFRDMLSGLAVGKHGLLALSTVDLRVIAETSQAAKVGGIGDEALPPHFSEVLRADPDYGTQEVQHSLGNIERTITYRKLPGWPLYVIIGLAAQDYLAVWWSEVIQLLALLSAFAAATLWLSANAKRAARREQAANRLFQEAVEHAAIGLSIFDPEQRLVICNKTFHGFFPELHDILQPGAPLDYIVRTGVLRGIYPKALENPEQWISQRMTFHRTADGRPFEQRISDGRHLLIIESRTPSGHVVSNRIDITELTQYRLNLEHLVATRTADVKAALDQLRILVELSPTGLAMFDKDLNYLAASRRWIELEGKSDGHLIGRHLYEVTPDFPEHWKAVHQAGLAGVTDSCEEDRWIRADGQEHWVCWVCHPWIDSSGQIGGIILSVDDITERKRAEQDLESERKARQAILEKQVAERTAELRAANQQLESFVYASSHDLRGPLGRISNFSTLLERNYGHRLEGDGLLFLNFIRDNALRLTRLVDDLLSHAQVDQLVADLQPIDLQWAVQRSLLEKREDLRGIGATAQVSLPAVQVLADPYGLSQVLHNLLENALKYSAQSSNPAIEIGGDFVEEARFRLWIRDNGVGFDMEYHDRIFEIFRRLHTHAEYPGTGVGLALVKRAMERMEGKVWAESKPGKGATFYLEFAVARLPTAAL